MKYLAIVKTLASLVVSVGVGAVISNIVKSTTPADVKRLMKACIGIGSLVLAGMISDAASKYTETKIDETVDMVKDAVKEAEPVQE